MIESYCSPRSSARRTVEILGLGIHSHQNFFNRETKSTSTTAPQLKAESVDPNIQITALLKEWDYGEYEGKTLWDINSLRKKQGMPGESTAWNIWTDGCPGGEYVLTFCVDFIFIHSSSLFKPVSFFLMEGEGNANSARSPQCVAARVDELIAEMKSVIADESASWPSGQVAGARSRVKQDVVCVAHGQVLTALALRWVGAPLSQGVMRLIFEPGGVAVLGYVYLCLCVCAGRGSDCNTDVWH